MGRISKDEYYLEIAKAVSLRSTCLRRQYGAVIVKNDEIIATGYNGSPRGTKNCCDKGYCYREAHNIPHGKQYEECVAVHAEQNAIISAPRQELLDSTLYLWGGENGIQLEDPQPCLICSRLIVNAGIKEVKTVKCLKKTKIVDKIKELVTKKDYREHNQEYLEEIKDYCSGTFKREDRFHEVTDSLKITHSYFAVVTDLPWFLKEYFIILVVDGKSVYAARINEFKLSQFDKSSCIEMSKRDKVFAEYYPEFHKKKVE